jgi:DNA-binding transcriptional regulator YdaS (Cro superfamily)
VDNKTSTALDRAIDACGGITKLAQALGANSHAVVHQWRLNRVPAERCPEIERETRRAAAEAGDESLIVTCEELRPDVAWGVLRVEPERA